MNRKVLTIYDLEELNDAAEYIISTAQFNLIDFNDQGEYIADQFSKEERFEKINAWCEGRKKHPLCFRYNEELRSIEFRDALEMPLSEIKEKYLNEHLPKLRNILRKDSACMNGVVVSNDVSDGYLDNLLALRWRENLKLWTMQWQRERTHKCGDTCSAKPY